MIPEQEHATPKFLKCMKNSRVFEYTVMLAERDDMIPCDVNGNITEGYVADAGEVEVDNRVKTPYLGNPVNGVLFPWSDVLATRKDMLSINTPEEWAVLMENKGHAAHLQVLPGGKGKTDGPSIEPTTDVPTLGRAAETSAVDKVKAGADVSHETIDTGPNPAPDGAKLPDIEGMGKREAKTTLSEWAEKNYGKKLDRKRSLPDVIDAAQALIHG